MNRRQFLKMASLLCAGAGMTVNSRLYAAGDAYTGPLWIFINAQGGWDVTSLCDPKGYNGIGDRTNPERLNNYDKANIEQIGTIKVAPPPDSFLPGAGNFDENLYSAKAFFEKYYSRLLVINGVDSKTNSHENGQLVNLSGRLRKGYPSFNALVSGVLTPDRALAFITNGGYSFTAGLTTSVRLNSSGLNALFEMAYPNRSSSPNSSRSRLYLPEDVQALIEQESHASHQAFLLNQGLLRVRTAVETLMQSRTRTKQLQSLANELENSPSRKLADFNLRRNAFRIYEQGRIALAGYQQGVTSSANIRMSGFDTHANHDKSHYPRLMDLLMGIDAILEEAKDRNLSERIVLVVTSDFGRTNRYNKNAGKDHWPIGSTMLIGNATQQITGNRVIGMTNDKHQAYPVDPVTLEPDLIGDNLNAVKLTPAHIHRSLRQLAGIDNSIESANFPLEGESLNLFN